MAWVQAARLRTLPLSLSGIITGTALANCQGFFDPYIFALALLTTIAFQVTSNFANDYGDGVKGLDGEDRIGPKRALQSGALGRFTLKRGIVISVVLSLVLALWLIYTAFGSDQILYLILFFILGILSIWAAIKYTVGRSPYGYRGLGDLFVFLFFGLLGVLGGMFLHTKNLDWPSLLPAIGIGLLCVGVLNLNNLRDMDSDRRHGKITLVVQMGFGPGKIYHSLLIILSLLCFLAYLFVAEMGWESSFFLLAFVPILVHLAKVLRTSDPGKLDGELKKLSLSTFILSILFYFAMEFFCSFG
jgi:1,4-dihydroxy-2-naphthoate octaprenyltransferase